MATGRLSTEVRFLGVERVLYFQFYEFPVFPAHLLIIRFVAKHMRHTIDEECNIQRSAEATVEHDPEGHPQGFIPKVPGHEDGNSDGANGEKDFIVLLLEHNDWVRLQIAHINRLAFGYHCWMGR